MQEQIQNFKSHVIEISKNPDFIHHKWFIDYHLNVVEQVAMELCDIYENADRDLVYLLVWLHDYWKILDYHNENETTLIKGKEKLLELWFDPELVTKAISFVEIMDKKESIDISQTALEIQIISSADGCSHLVWPFFKFWWYENSHKDIHTLIEDNIYKWTKDWDKKIVLPEAKKAFEYRHKLLLERDGNFPDRFIQ